MKRFGGILASMVLLVLQVHAQWSLQQCVDTALVHNLTIWQDRLSVRVSELNLQQNRLNRWPALNASLTQNFNFGRSLDQTTYQYINQSAATNGIAVNAGALLYNGGQLRNTIHQSRVLVEASQTDLQQSQNDVILAVINAFVEFIYAKEAIRNAEHQVVSTEALMEQTRLFVEAGKKAESDLVQLEAQKATDQYMLGVAKSNEAATSLQLQQLMEVPFDDHFDIVAPELQEPSFYASAVNASSVYEKALTTQPYIRSGQLRIEGEQWGLRAIRGGLLPRVSISGGIGTNYSSVRRQMDIQTLNNLETIGFLKDHTDEEVLGYVSKTAYSYNNYPFLSQLSQNLNQALSINIIIPIFNNRQVRTQLLKQEVAIQAAQVQDRLNRNDLRKKVEQAYVDYQSSWLNYQAAKRSFEAERLSWENLQLKFEASKSTATDLLIEKNRLAQQESQVLQARYAVILKEKILDFYEGRPLKF